MQAQQEAHRHPHKIYDVFIAYNTEDKKQVWEIIKALEQKGICCCTDENFPAGVSATQSMSQCIRQSKSVAIFIGTYGAGKWQGGFEQPLAIHKTMNDASPLIPVLLPGIQSMDEVVWDNGFEDYLKTRTAVKFTTTQDAQALVKLVSAIPHSPPSGVPYGILVEVPEAAASCFLAMPKRGLWEIYTPIAQVAKAAGIQIFQTKTLRGDRTNYVDSIQDIIDKIRSATAVIAVCVLKKSIADGRKEVADIDTEVMYELGLAHALGKPLLLIVDACNLKFLLSHILQDVPEKSFLKYDPLTDSKEQLETELTQRFAEIKQNSNFPRIDDGLKNIQVIQARNYMCILPDFWENFHNILDFGIDIHHHFTEIQVHLTALYKEIEEVKSIYERECQNQAPDKEIEDIKTAWQSYQDCDRSMWEKFSTKFTDQYYQALEASLKFFEEGRTQQFDQTARYSYNTIKSMMLGDYQSDNKKIEGSMNEPNFAGSNRIRMLEAVVCASRENVKACLIEQSHKLVLKVVKLISPYAKIFTN
ncbi:MAG: TIR domain-containing protein [Leptolyngbya sp. Prado105]|jgi:hypothetical protein|nr:TIR domain-containing protein [Leptolyngbya sp. Prado105]